MKKLAKAKAALAEAASTNGVANGNINNGEPNVVSSDGWMLTKKEKKKRKEELAAAAAANESMDTQNNVKERKKAKKRKLEKENGAEAKIDWAQEVDQVLPLNGDSGKKKKEGDEPEKKKKKKEKAQHLETPKEEVVEEVKEKGPFKKIFYKPTKATLSIPDEQVKAFQEKHKMNLTGAVLFFS